MTKIIPPLRFVPQFQYRLWGGNKLQTQLGKDYQKDSMGESWEISAVDRFPSVIEDGPWKGKTLLELITAFPEAVLVKNASNSMATPFRY